MLLARGLHTPRAVPEVPGRDQLHVHRLVPRLARAGARLRHRQVHRQQRAAGGKHPK